ELEPRTGDEIFHGARDEHLAGACERGDPRAGVDGDPGDLSVHELALTGVEPGTDVDAEVTDSVGDRLRTAHGPRRSVERGEEAVACGIELAPARACEL